MRSKNWLPPRAGRLVRAYVCERRYVRLRYQMGERRWNNIIDAELASDWKRAAEDRWPKVIVTIEPYTRRKGVGHVS